MSATRKADLIDTTAAKGHSHYVVFIATIATVLKPDNVAFLETIATVVRSILYTN